MFFKAMDFLVSEKQKRYQGPLDNPGKWAVYALTLGGVFYLGHRFWPKREEE